MESYTNKNYDIFISLLQELSNASTTMTKMLAKHKKVVVLGQ